MSTYFFDCIKQFGFQELTQKDFPFAIYAKGELHVVWVGYVHVRHFDLLKTIPDKYVNCVVIWEDQWITKQNIILSRIKHMTIKSERIGARKTKLVGLNIETTQLFLNQNHMIGSTNARYRFGLEYNDTLLAVCTFGNKRNLTYNFPTVASFMLERFCTSIGTAVIGGLSKFMHHFTALKSAEHIMTYVDLDLGDGYSFQKIGFKKVDLSYPAFWLNAKTHQRIYEKEVIKHNLNLDNDWVKCSGSGTLKLIYEPRA